MPSSSSLAGKVRIMSVVTRPRMIRMAVFYTNNCAKSTAFKWVNQGKLRAYKLGRMTFVDETFDEFVARQASQYEVKSPPRPPGRPRKVPREEAPASAPQAAAP